MNRTLGGPMLLSAGIVAVFVAIAACAPPPSPHELKTPAEAFAELEDAAATLKPGMWRTTSVADIHDPGFSPLFTTAFEKPLVKEECLIVDGMTKFMGEQVVGISEPPWVCSVDRLLVGQEYVLSDTSCRFPDGTRMTHHVEAGYSAERLEVVGQSSRMDARGVVAKIEARVVSEWVGACLD